jgi:hypothetical protein
MVSMSTIPSFGQFTNSVNICLKHSQAVEKWFNRAVVVLAGSACLVFALYVIATQIKKYFSSIKPPPPASDLPTAPPVPSLPPPPASDLPTAPPVPSLPIDPEVLGLSSVLVRLRAKDSKKFLAALQALSSLAINYKWRSDAHKKIAEIFYKSLPKLPKEQLFPEGEPTKEMKQLFVELAKNMSHSPHWNDPAFDELHCFCKTLTPMQGERFLKLVPLSFIPPSTVAGIHEMSRRFNLGQIKEQDFKEHFDFYFQGVQYLITNGAYFFFEGVSVQLLARLLDVYSTEFHIDYQAHNALKAVSSLAGAHRKLMLLVNWYSKNSSRWNPFQQAHRLIILLGMAQSLLSRIKVPNLQQLNSRQMKGSGRILTPSMTRGWIPEKYKSWSKLCKDAQVNPKVTNKDWSGVEVEGIRKYFDP